MAGVRWCAFYSVALFLFSSTGHTHGGLHMDANFSGDEVRMQQGQLRLAELRSHTSSPRYGECWTKAIEMLESSCKHLTEDVQHRLAFHFTRCFMLKSGRKGVQCSDDEESSESAIASCTSRMQPDEFSAFTTFFTHTQDICFYLQAAVWHQQTEETIDRLTDSSATVAQQLEDASEQQRELIRKQNESLQYQQRLLESSGELQKTLEQSKVDVRAVMQELQRTTSEQRDLIFEVFDRLKSLQSLVLGEFTGFYSLIFYAVAVLIAYLLTSTPRTSGARFWMFVILSLNVGVEWIVAKWYNTDNQLDPVTGLPVDENTLVFDRLRACRKCFVSLAIAAWVWIAYRYQDFNRLNNQLLVDIKHKLLDDIKRQNAELKLLLQSQVRGRSAVDGTIDVDVSVTKSINVRDSQPTTGYESSSETTDIDEGGTRPVAVTPVVTQLPSEEGGGSKRIRKTPNRRRTEADRLSQSLDMSSSTSRYNLRARTSTPTAEFPVATEDITDHEVQHLVGVMARNRAKAFRLVQNSHQVVVRAIKNKTTLNAYSSDED